MRKTLYVICFLLIPSISFSQSDSLSQAYKKIAEHHCLGGAGDGSFNLTLNSIENIFLSHYTIDILSKKLPQHSCEVAINYTYNEKTKFFDVPEFNYTYSYLKPIGIEVIAIVPEKINHKITHLTVNGISSLTYDKFYSRLLNSGYLYRASISNNLEKHFFNKQKSIIVILKKNRFGNYSIEIG